MLTTAALVEDELGASLTAEQLLQLDGLMLEAGAAIARRTGRAFDATSPATETLVVASDGVLYLSSRPVSAITSVSVRPPSIGGASAALVSLSSYELVDASTGALLVASAYAGWLATVVYTHAATVPGDVQRAATLLAVLWMLPRLHPERAGLAELSLGQDVRLKMSVAEMRAEIDRLLDARTALVLA